MEPLQRTPADSSSRLALTLGLVPTILGALTLFGWFTHTRVLIQMTSASAPMKFNTALGLIIVGVSVILLGRSRIADIAGGDSGGGIGWCHAI